MFDLTVAGVDPDAEAVVTVPLTPAPPEDEEFSAWIGEVMPLVQDDVAPLLRRIDLAALSDACRAAHAGGATPEQAAAMIRAGIAELNESAAEG